MFWRRAGACNFRGRLDHWQDYLNEIFLREKVTEIILLGEERPHHKIARELAAKRNIDVYAIEMGYLRPDWISIEMDGAGSNSHFPNSAADILKAAADLDDPDTSVRYRHSFAAEVACDLAYNLPNVFLWFMHPHYRWHALAHPMAEYYGWLRRFALTRRRAGATERTLGQLQRSQARFFFYPLQLQTDYQIRAHSPFRSQEQVIDLVLRSFAEQSPTNVQLVLKTHPLDNGLVDWKQEAFAAAERLGIADRLQVIFGGDLSSLLSRSEGIVTVNSTVGIQALAIGKPVKVLGTAIYDIDGLTDQKPLEAFWGKPEAPSLALRDAFLRLLAAAIHERGNFYSKEGAKAAAKAIAQRIHERRVNEPGAFVPVPPRARPTKIDELDGRRDGSRNR
jgi:capsular polysaccharide export protein